MSVEHWHCSCGAFGHSNMWDLNTIIKGKHVIAGHTVESWERGRRKETLVVSTSVSEKR